MTLFLPEAKMGGWSVLACSCCSVLAALFLLCFLPKEFAPPFDRMGISAEIWCRLVKDFGRLFSVVAGQPKRIDEYRSKGSSRRYRSRKETRELLATA